MVNHPPHYKQHPSGVEVIQITEHMNFCLGNAVKYILRADHKGNTIEDLKKAAWYVNREIARREKEAAPQPTHGFIELQVPPAKKRGRPRKPLPPIEKPKRGRPPKIKAPEGFILVGRGGRELQQKVNQLGASSDLVAFHHHRRMWDMGPHAGNSPELTYAVRKGSALAKHLGL